MSKDISRTATPRPARITVAAVLVAVQGAVVVAFGVTMLVMLLSGDRVDDVTQAVTGAATVLVLALLPLAAARGLWLCRRWSRGPAMIVQLMALPTSWQLAQNGGAHLVAGIALAAAALAVLACLVNPTATEALGIGPREIRDA